MNKLKKFNWIVYVLLAFVVFKIMLVLDTANDERIQTEGEATRDTFAFIESAKFLGTLDTYSYAIALPHNYDLLFYKKDVIFVPKNYDKGINCLPKECNFYEISSTKKSHMVYNNNKLRLIKSFYQPNAKQYILIYINE